MKVLFCVYRDWAIGAANDVYDKISHRNQFRIVCEPTDMEKVARQEPWDMIVLIGWSWKIPSDIVNSTLVIGMHPSDLPAYAGGSPIQNQILDGLTESVATLFRLNEEFDKGEILSKEKFSLQGHLHTVFDSLRDATVKLVVDAINNHPNHTFVSQGQGGFTRKRLKPSDSKLSSYDMNDYTCKQIFDFIRCREDPYPNAYMEDGTGKLVFKIVEFIPR